MTTTNIPGYTLGSAAPSPVTLAEFETMQKTALFGDDDVRALRLSLDVLKDQVEAILDVWYGFVGSQPHLLASFSGGANGQPQGDYLGAVRKRFGQWILDTAAAQFEDDEARKAILDLRQRVDQNNAQLTARQTEQVEQMHAAWLKSCLLQLTLWSHPYVKDGDF